ncbi:MULTISPECIES: multicopper oxidase family protein [Jeotgalibacillus]|uniref:Multicopper oxidase n=2 Tax=Jeotgalibacillus TaxID=157226 RepID=A0A0B5ALZ0_9BACL|nr:MULTISPECIES: multicopper oxidase domain-containing protein [Jeotgalibacillus]AJD89558.1 multicopper oxidase [Jeotgalibacillus malaysiensis]MBM7578526.1 FtsP/CotA-like multicopper oxidase with cupredoxin domain [Jeotgalibacillus terrae]
MKEGIEIMQKKLLKGTLSILAAIILSACTGDSGGMNSSMMMDNEDNPDQGMDQDGMNEMMDHGEVPSLASSEGVNELVIPPLLEKQKGKNYDYEVTAQEGITEFFEGISTETYGYNGDLLGPTLKIEEGESVNVKITNDLNEPTTFHWHGLEVASKIDGGPSDEIQPGESRIITLEADQPAATLWYHPHVHEMTAEQVFRGLSGMLIIDNSINSDLEIPNEYGVNDIPLIFQDRLFDEDKQLDYDNLMNVDGTLGDVSMVNGTINPKMTVTEPIMRFRLLNGSNARNYTFRLSNGDNFTQIASDGSLLDEPVDRKELTLAASERAEILIDFSKLTEEESLSIINEEGVVLLPFDVKDTDSTAGSIKTWTTDEPFLTDEEKEMPVTKNIELFGMMDMVSINGKKFDADRIDLRQEQGVTEVWEIYNKPDMMGGMVHPFHIHGTQFKVISRDGEEVEESEQGFKDSVAVEPGERVKLLVTFPEKGVYVFHCHILEHEDNGMMGQIEVY